MLFLVFSAFIFLLVYMVKRNGTAQGRFFPSFFFWINSSRRKRAVRRDGFGRIQDQRCLRLKGMRIFSIKRKPAQKAADRTALEEISFRKRKERLLPGAAAFCPAAQMGAPAAATVSEASLRQALLSAGDTKEKQSSGRRLSAVPQNRSEASIQSMENISKSGKKLRNRLSAHNACACITSSFLLCVSMSTTKITFCQNFVNMLGQRSLLWRQLYPKRI